MPLAPRQVPRHIRGHLQASAAISALLADLQRREALLESVRAVLPDPMAGHCVQATLEDGHLTLVVDSPVWVDRLRFLAPQLSVKLSGRLSTDSPADEADAIRDCRVRAQPALQLGTSRPAPRWYRGGASPDAVRSVESAAAALGTSPLADSLHRLAKTLERHG
jgi:hypothetical protein